MRKKKRVRVQNVKNDIKVGEKKKKICLGQSLNKFKKEIERTHEKVSCIARFYTSTHIS